MIRFTALLLGSLLLCGPALAETETSAFAVSDQSTIHSLLRARLNTPVTLRLASGEELSGQLQSVGGQFAHLHALSGREFFDAAVRVDRIEALIVRTRSR